MRHATMALGVSVALLSCADEPMERGARFGGASMGTTFSIQVVDVPKGVTRSRLQADVARILDAIDGAMSTWRDDSELARFNAQRSTEWVDVDPGTWKVVTEARRVAQLTDGALDVTVGPLVDLWGFGRDGPRSEPPPPDALMAAWGRVGWEHLHVDATVPALRKTTGGLSVDLSALAKGYAIDTIAEHLRSLGIRRCLIEFGGELRGCGLGPGGRPWRVGIERSGEPVGAPVGAPVEALVLELSEGAVATSGDGHNATHWDGRRYCHVIDPRSGKPVAHELTSVSVVAPTALVADALATALFVLGPERGLELAEREGLAALFVRREGQGLTREWTQAMAPWLATAAATAPVTAPATAKAHALNRGGESEMNPVLTSLLPSVLLIAAAMAALAFGISRRAGKDGASLPADGRGSSPDSCRLCASPCEEDTTGSTAASGGLSR